MAASAALGRSDFVANGTVVRPAEFTQAGASEVKARLIPS